MNWKLVVLVLLGANIAFANPDKKLQKIYNKKQYQKLLIKSEKWQSKLDEKTFAQYQLLASVKLNPNLKDVAVTTKLNSYCKVLITEKQKNKWQKLALNEYKQYILKSASVSKKEKDSLNLALMAEIMLENFSDSCIYRKYIFKKTAIPNQVVVKETEIKKTNRDSIFFYADRTLGVPYKWAGTSPTTGFDCSGYTQFLYRKAGIELLHFAKEQAKEGKETEWTKAEKGDLIFFGKRYENGRTKIDHVGIFHSVAANGNPVIVHCSSNGTLYQELKPGDYWMKKILFCRNVIDYVNTDFLTNK